MEKTRITIVAVTCIALFFLTNYLFRYLIGFTGLLASLVIAALIAVYMSFSIARTLERLPMPEHTCSTCRLSRRGIAQAT